jgi:Ca2+-binding RTX toxin-like protein
MLRFLLPLALMLSLAAPAAAAVDAEELCAGAGANETCVDGGGRTTPGGGEKVSHKGWPRVTGILWQVKHSDGSRLAGGEANDELLGHHGSDTITGSEGHDILWGDWDPKNNNGAQRDVLRGGAGNDWIYPSHGTTRVNAGPGRDYVWAFYGRGTIDCGPGNDTVRVRMNGAFRVKNCETINHFCAFGSDGNGGCLKPGAKARRR